MMRAPRAGAAFSLIEVIIALGIVSFAVVAMMALMSSLFLNVRETESQNEAMQFAPSLNDFLQTSGFTTVYGWVQSGKQPQIFSYCALSNNIVQMVISTNSGAVPSPDQRKGRLFQATLSFSPDNSSGLQSLPGMAAYTGFSLPLRITFYNTPSASATPSSNNLVLSYETAVSR